MGCRTSFDVIHEVQFVEAWCFVLYQWSSHLDVPNAVMYVRAFVFISLRIKALTIVSFCCSVFLDRESSMPQQLYWQTGKMKVSSRGKNSLSKVASSRRTLQR